MLENKIPLNEECKQNLVKIACQLFTDIHTQYILAIKFFKYIDKSYPNNNLIRTFIDIIDDSNMKKQNLARKNFETNVENTTSPQVLLDFLYNKYFLFNNNLVAIYKQLNDFFPPPPEILPLDIWQC